LKSSNYLIYQIMISVFQVSIEDWIKIAHGIDDKSELSPGPDTSLSNQCLRDNPPLQLPVREFSTEPGKTTAVEDKSDLQMKAENVPDTRVSTNLWGNLGGNLGGNLEGNLGYQGGRLACAMEAMCGLQASGRIHARLYI
jgi:hypothetical protein